MTSRPKSQKYQAVTKSDPSLQSSSGNMSSQRNLDDLAREAAGMVEDDYDITTKRIEWDKISSKYASNADINCLRRLEGDRNSDELLAPEGDIEAIFFDSTESIATAKAFVRVLQTSIADHLAYILALLSHILQQDNKRGEAFLRLESDSLIQTFQRIWGRDEISSYTRGKAAICAAIIMGQAYEYEKKTNNNNNNNNKQENENKNNENDNEMKYDEYTAKFAYRRSRYKKEYKILCQWMLREFKKKNDELLPSLYALKGIIGNGDFQSLFCQKDIAGIHRLNEILSSKSEHRQVVYLVVYCLWVLSFSKEYATHENLLYGQLISQLVKLIPVTKQKNRKIARVILQMFENLLDQENFNEMLVRFNLFPILQEMEEEKVEKKNEDQEMKNSITKILDKLSHSVKILSSIESYKVELRSDKLSWGPCHNEGFWKKYSHMFEEDNYEMIQTLIELLQSHDPETLAVACYDLGEWSRFYSDAKRVIEKFGGKQLMMGLINHEDPEVRKHALSSVQKLLIKNWQSLDSGN